MQYQPTLVEAWEESQNANQHIKWLPNDDFKFRIQDSKKVASCVDLWWLQVLNEF